MSENKLPRVELFAPSGKKSDLITLQNVWWCSQNKFYQCFPIYVYQYADYLPAVI